jgi:D-glycero-D-manno-heptose 1,7-bisphosphate phosphatase
VTGSRKDEVARGPLRRAPSPAVFIDRDDTLVHATGLPAPAPPANPGDLFDPALVRLFEGVGEACGRLHDAGFRLVVVSNQGSVARGAATIADVERTNARLRELVPCLDAVYFCPFHPKGTVPAFTREDPWRKPAPGMILAAAADLDLDLGRSWLVGDAERDIQAGLNAGLAPERCLRIGAGTRLADFPAAADHILRALR